jgi:hypothetical protein
MERRKTEETRARSSACWGFLGGQCVKLPSKIRGRQLPIGSGDQDAAYYERERPSGSYSKSISHLMLRAFSDRAHSIDLQRKGSQIVPLSK